jgi:hypothetical protein
MPYEEGWETSTKICMKCGCPHGDPGRICGECEEFGEDDDYEY